MFKHLFTEEQTGAPDALGFAAIFKRDISHVPRDGQGQWTDGKGTEGAGGKGAAGGAHPGKGYSKGAYLDKKGAGHTDDVEDALRALHEGKHVVLKQPKQVSTLIDRLAQIGNEAHAKGEKAPLYDLCKVSVKGTAGVDVDGSPGLTNVKGSMVMIN